MTTKRRHEKTVEILARKVRESREALQLSQEELARLAKLDPAAVSRIENAQAGSRGIGLARLERLAQALRFDTVSDLLRA